MGTSTSTSYNPAAKMGVLERAKTSFGLGVREMMGYTWDGQTKTFEGWGHNVGHSSERLALGAGAAEPSFMQQVTGTYGPRVAKTGLSKGLSIGGSVVRVGLGPVLSAYQGWSEDGLLGASKWMVAELAQSAIIGGAVASGAISGIGGGLTAGGFSMVGATVGGPMGYVGGAWLGTQVAAGGAVGAMALPVTLGAAAAGVGAYYAMKGTYSTLKNGYNYRQQQLRKINTAGSVAGMMNRNAFTMRSKAMAAASQTNTNIQAAFGNEAGRSHYNSYRSLR